MPSRTSHLFNPTPTPKQVQVPTPDTVNTQGRGAYSRETREQYVQMLLTNTFGAAYYTTEKQNIKEAAALHRTMLAKDPVFMAKALVYARQRGFMRSQPIYGLAVLAEAPADLLGAVFNSVILTPGDLSDFLTVVRSLRTKTTVVNGKRVEHRSIGGRRVKRAIESWLKTRLTEYWAIKYNSQSNGGYSLSDVLKLARPKLGWDTVVRYVLKGFVTPRDEIDGPIDPIQQIRAYEAFKVATTDEEKVRLIILGRLPHEVATATGKPSAAVWKAIVPQMPVFALLKNLAAIERAGVMNGETLAHVEATMGNLTIISRSKILPFRFLEAEKHVTAARVKDALRHALELSFANIPTIQGETAVLLDTSGSMDGDFLQTATVFGLAVVKKTQASLLYTFSNSAKQVQVSRLDTILTQASRIHAGGGTNTSAPVDLMIVQKQRVDNIVLITDGQQNEGRAFASALADYRQKVNKQAKLFVVDISPYKASVAPEVDGYNYTIYGWSDQALQFIALTSEGYNNIVEVINQTQLQPAHYDSPDNNAWTRANLGLPAEPGDPGYDA